MVASAIAALDRFLSLSSRRADPLSWYRSRHLCVPENRPLPPFANALMLFLYRQPFEVSAVCESNPLLDFDDHQIQKSFPPFYCHLVHPYHHSDRRDSYHHLDTLSLLVVDTNPHSLVLSIAFPCLPTCNAHPAPPSPHSSSLPNLHAIY